ncbi:cytochrome b5-like heme/steroid binding domain-containing protein, partial [Lasiosphaeris hirsuta]
RHKVYDISKYLKDHPGGDVVLKDVAGTDATKLFDEVGHSEEANEELKQFFIGDLAEEV